MHVRTKSLARKCISVFWAILASHRHSLSLALAGALAALDCGKGGSPNSGRGQGIQIGREAFARGVFELSGEGA